MTGVAESVGEVPLGPSPAGQDDGGSRAGRSRPGWVFHTLLVLGSVVLVYAFSVPGVISPLPSLGLSLWLLLGVVWVVRLVQCVATHRRLSWWFVIAPLIVVTTIAVLATNVPLKARWELSRDAFSAAVAGTGPEVSSGTIGSYTITSRWRVPGGVFFREAHGQGLDDDAGFAYLPNGPSRDMGTTDFESPHFTPLDDGWYAWTASW